VDGGAHAPGSVLTFTADVTTAAGYTARATAQASVVAGGLNVSMTPDSATVEPQLQDRNAIEPRERPDARSQIFTISVHGPSGPVAGAVVSANLEVFPGGETFGGHDHGVDGRPLWTLGRLARLRKRATANTA